MAKPSVTKNIDTWVFEFFPLSPKVSLRLLTRISKLVLEPLGLLGDALKSGAETEGGEIESPLDKKIPADTFAKVAKAIVARLDEDEILTTMEMMFAPNHVHCKSPDDKGTRPCRFESDFSGQIGLMLKAFAAGIEVNFGDFLGASGGGLGALMDRAKGLI